MTASSTGISSPKQSTVNLQTSTAILSAEQLQCPTNILTALLKTRVSPRQLTMNLKQSSQAHTRKWQTRLTATKWQMLSVKCSPSSAEPTNILTKQCLGHLPRTKQRRIALQQSCITSPRQSSSAQLSLKALCPTPQRRCMKSSILKQDLLTSLANSVCMKVARK